MWHFDVSLTRPDAAFLMLDEGKSGLFALLTADLRELERGVLQTILCKSAATVPWWTSEGLREFADGVDRDFGLVREPRKLVGGALAAAAFTRTQVHARVLGDARVGLVEADELRHATRPHLLMTETLPAFIPDGVPLDVHGSVMSRWVGSGRASEGYAWSLRAPCEIVLCCYEASVDAPAQWYLYGPRRFGAIGRVRVPQESEPQPGLRATM